MNNKNFIIVIIILVVVAGVTMSAYLPSRFETGITVKMADFPKTVGEWTSKDIPLSKRDFEILETTNLIMREYNNPKGETVYLYIIYSENNRRVMHPPEICYTGGGSTIIEKSVVQITNNIKANRFTIEDKDLRQLVVYWFKTANLNTYSYIKQQLKMVTDRMLGKKISGAMIRMSTNFKENGQEAALGLIKSFANQIEPLLTKYVP
jgi:EpsI family protein